MTAKQWGEPVIVCGPHYEKVIYPNDRIANVRVDCCGLPDDVARKEGCEAYRDRMEPCDGLGFGAATCAYNESSIGRVWVNKDHVRDCEADECPLKLSLPKARAAGAAS